MMLCIPAHAEDNLSVNEVMNIILDHHGVETDMDVSEYLTLGAVDMTREAAITAVIRSYGIYPANEPDYLWVDEEEQAETYRPYIDYARRMGITQGIGNGYFAPNQPVTEWELRTMLDRANGIEPEYPLSYDSNLCKLLSADIQYGLSLVPDFLVDRFYIEGRTITATKIPIYFQTDHASLTNTSDISGMKVICGYQLQMILSHIDIRTGQLSMKSDILSDIEQN